MRKKTIGAGLVIIAAVGLGVILTIVIADENGPATGRLAVTATFYPMAEFARQVGGDRVDVSTLVSAGVEPHDYDPTPQDIAGVHKSAVFIYNDAGLEPWVGRIQDELEGEGVVVVDASQGIELMTKGAGEETGDSAGVTPYDPHIWLDPVLAAKQVDNIRDGLIEADPESRDYYQANADAFKERLAGLDDAYRLGLADCARRQIITSHQAFRYLASRYDIDVIAISGLSPDEEPSPQKLAEVARFARQYDVRYIFFETLASPRLSDTIAGEVGAGTLVFNPLEGLTGEDIAQGKDYISVQEDNLENLRLALDCK